MLRVSSVLHEDAGHVQESAYQPQPLTAVTVFQAQGARRANKLVRLKPDGQLEKISQPELGLHSFLAREEPVNSLADLAKVLFWVGARPDAVLSLGRFKNLPPGTEKFHVHSKRVLVNKLKRLGRDIENVDGLHEIDGEIHTARLKNNMTLGRVVLLDRDIVPGMPDELKALDADRWWPAMCAIFPGFEGAGRIIMPSTTRRILLNGVTQSTKPNFHCYVLGDSASEIARAFGQFRIRALNTFLPGTETPLAFIRPTTHSKTGHFCGRIFSSIFDHTVCSPERLVFVGAPRPYVRPLS